MTISSTTRKAGPFVGNDSASAFPFAFKVFQSADVYVVRLNSATSVESVLALTTDYTVSLNADQNANPGGTVTLVAGALATGYTLTITSSITPLQATDLTNQGGFYPAVVTNALDKLTILVQQILERLGRSLTLPLSTPTNVSTALPFPEANKALAWNSSGTALANYDASQLATSILGSNTIVDRFPADGSAGPYTLSASPLTVNNTLVHIAGVLQAHNTYVVADNQITFDDAVANGLVVEVMQQLAVTYPVSALTPNVVDTINLVDDSVTADKIAAGAVGTSELADDSVTAAKIAAGAVGTSELADDSVTAAKIAAGAVGTSEIADSAVTQAKAADGVGRMTLTASQATTSGTAIDFTGIPSWAKRLTVMLNGVSTNGSSALTVQVGAGSIETTGYAGAGGYTGTASAAGLMSNGFATETASGAGVTRHGHCTLTHLGGNVWVFSSVHGRSDSAYMHIAGGSKTVSGTLDRIRLTATNLTDAFDAGSVSLLIEG